MIRPEDALTRLNQPDSLFVDCRFYVDDQARGEDEYYQEHIPGAVYAHLERDLSGIPIAGQTSRHPLPDAQQFSKTCSAWGIDSNVEVIVYDNFRGGIAGRLWWLLTWLGHPRVMWMTGGWQAWRSAGYPKQSGPVRRSARSFQAHPRPEMLIDTPNTHSMHTRSDWKFIDTRHVRSFTGEKDPASPKTGHIPGAHNLHYETLTTPEGYLLPEEQLRNLFHPLLANHPAGQTVMYCTSGVTACLNILVLNHLGLGLARLYAGSWDEWITDPHRPVEKGNRADQNLG